MTEKLTANFYRNEFACKCGCGLDNIDIGIVNRLQVVRDIIGVPITVNSGCRCEKHNRNVGGATDSFHLKGLAVDFRTSVALTLENLANLLCGWSGGFHYYGNFIHIDIGPKRRW